ncbi:MAG: hypothetical protein IKF82_07390 [Bacilli bacterium]|nr:hypothetical protein [Bacilli bacterium]
MELDRIILKKLWNGEKVLCPKCNEDYLIPLHKKKKDNDDFQCPKCKEVFSNSVFCMYWWSISIMRCNIPIISFKNFCN